MKKIKVFIASTGTEKYFNKAEELSNLLLKKVDTVFWKESFKLGATNIEALEKSAATCDFFVVLLSAEDITRKKGRKDLQPRDNLIYELGLFTGALGRYRAIGIIDKDNKPCLPTDLDGMVFFECKIQSDDFAEQAQNKLLAHISEHGLKSDTSTELSFLYRATNVFTYPLYPKTKKEILNSLFHRGEEAFEHISNVIEIISDSFEVYLSNCIPGIRQGSHYVGYQYYIGDGAKIDKKSVVRECKDKSLAGEDVCGKFVMGVSTKTQNLQEWQIGRVSPGYDSSGAPLSICASVFKTINAVFKADTRITNVGPKNDDTPGELTIYTCPIVWASEHEKECLGVLSISGNKSGIIDQDMKNRINFSSMLISYVFSIYANNRTKEPSTTQEFRKGATKEKFNPNATMIRQEIASYFENMFISKKIHRLEGRSLVVCQNQ